MAETINLGIVGIKNMGEYDSQTSYEKLNVVTYQGSSYCAIKDSTGNLPTNTEYWQLYAEKGSKGDTGPQGPKPVKGVDYYTQEDKEEISDEIATDVADEVSNQVGDLVSATPLAAVSISDMTDTTRIYVLVTDGYWYYYDGDSWERGGVYQSATDPIDPDFYNLTNYYPLNNNGMIGPKGQEYSYTSYKKSDFIPVISNKFHLEGTFSGIASGDGCYVAFYSFDKTFIKQNVLDTQYTEFDIDIPENVYYIKLSNKNANVSSMNYSFYNQNININKLGISQFVELRTQYPNSIEGYVDTDGTLIENDSFRRTDYIPCLYGKLRLLGTLSLLSTGTYVTFFDSNKNYIGKATVDTSETLNDITIPSSCYYVIITNHKNNPTDYYFFNSSIDLSKLNKIFYDVNYSAFAGFKKFGVIGDSLSVGYMQDSESHEYGRNIWYSWPQYLARYLNTTALNFGFSGASSKTWYNNQNHGYVEFVQPDNLCQAYIVGLGANDSGASGNIGSISDINWTNRDANADSFYGNYGKILQAINAVAPQAKIFVLTLPYPRISDNKNNAIRTLANDEHLNNITLVDLEETYNNYFTNSNIKDLAWAMHFTASGYSNIAKFMNYALNEEMVKNASEFIDIFKIPYGSNNIIE